MKDYEIVWEIYNNCSNNQMRDVFIEEKSVADLDKYVNDKFHDKDFSYEKTIMPDGTVIYDIMTSGIKQRLSFTEL